MSAFYVDRAGRTRDARTGKLTPEERERVLRECVQHLAGSSIDFDDTETVRHALALADSVEIKT